MRRTAASARLVAAALTAAAVAVVPAASSQATTPLPSLRLVTGLHHVEVERFQDDPYLYIPASVFVAATNGAFEIDAVRAHHKVELWQVVRSGGAAHRVRRITPPVPAHISVGLPLFFDVAMRDSNGKLVARTQQPFCPVADYGAARVSASGPSHPTYPYYCGSNLTHAMVWGINRGWSTPIYTQLNVASDQVPDGDYTLHLRIDRVYARQLHIKSADSHTTLTVTITTTTNTCPPEIVCNGRPAVRHQATATSGQTAGYTASSPSGAGLPDLRALPAHGLSVEHNADNGKDYLDFGATIWNAGPGPLDVEGFRHTDRPTMTARQFFHQPGHRVTSQVIGRFEFDTRPGHNHWHLEDFARYDLLSVQGDQLVRSTKQSFCLAPTDPIDLTLKGARWQPDQVGLFSSCPTDQSIWLRETLPAGWGDTYIQSKAGQSFNITGLANGRYLIRVTTNPFDHIVERSHDNNTSLLEIRLGGQPGARTVTSLGAVHP